MENHRNTNRFLLRRFNDGLKISSNESLQKNVFLHTIKNMLYNKRYETIINGR